MHIWLCPSQKLLLSHLSFNILHTRFTRGSFSSIITPKPLVFCASRAREPKLRASLGATRGRRPSNIWPPSRRRPATTPSESPRQNVPERTGYDGRDIAETRSTLLLQRRPASSLGTAPRWQSRADGCGEARSLARAGTKLKFCFSETPSELRDVTFGRNVWGRTSRKKRKTNTHTQACAPLQIRSRLPHVARLTHGPDVVHKGLCKKRKETKNSAPMCIYTGAPPTRRRRFPFCHPSSADSGLCFFNRFPMCICSFGIKKKWF